MASGDSFLKTLTIEGECDRACKMRKFKDPMIYVRLPKRALGRGREQPNRSRRGHSSLSVMDDQKHDIFPLVTADTVGDSSSVVSRHTDPVLGPLSKMWLPICFSVINAVCYAIEPATGALMMTYSTLLLHHMGAVGRGLTVAISTSAMGVLLLAGSDMVYIMLVHVLYYCAVCMAKLASAEYSRTKRSYGKKHG